MTKTKCRFALLIFLSFSQRVIHAQTAEGPTLAATMQYLQDNTSTTSVPLFTSTLQTLLSGDVNSCKMTFEKRTFITAEGEQNAKTERAVLSFASLKEAKPGFLPPSVKTGSMIYTVRLRLKDGSENDLLLPDRATAQKLTKAAQHAIALCKSKDDGTDIFGESVAASTPAINEVSTYPDPTGLVWAGHDNGDEPLSYQQAVDYCGELHLGGLSNWRLPTLDEIRIMSPIPYDNDFTKGPKGNIEDNPDRFVRGGVRVAGGFDWTTTQRDASRAYFSFSYRTAGLREEDFPPSGHALCVHGSGDAALLRKALHDAEPQVVTDSTGKLWPRFGIDVARNVSAGDAVAACQRLKVDDITGWRLPTPDEVKRHAKKRTVGPWTDGRMSTSLTLVFDEKEPGDKTAIGFETAIGVFQDGQAQRYTYLWCMEGGHAMPCGSDGGGMGDIDKKAKKEMEKTVAAVCVHDPLQ
jgi:hypothetical protein